MSYVFRENEGILEHLHWGNEVSSEDNLSYLAADFYEASFDTNNRMNSRLLEYSDYGNGDFRIPSARIYFPSDGSLVSSFRYSHHLILDGLPPEFHSEGNLMPHVKGSKDDTKTLVVFLKDQRSVTLELWYSIFKDYPAVARSTKFSNTALNESIYLEEANSVSIDFAPALDAYSLIHLAGSHIRERQIFSETLLPGVKVVESRRGASSHQHNPFVVLTDGEPQEESGNCFGIGLFFPSSFRFSAEVTQTYTLRATIGIHPEQFRYLLKPSESWTSPVALLFFSDLGLSKFSRQLHRLITKRVSPETHRNNLRPVLLNSWESMYFDVSEKNIMDKLVLPAKDTGIDLIVLDDGWFKGRFDDRRALGDWIVDENKFPSGLKGLSEKINAEGFQFGIWVEPEMISKNSDLFRQHPEWALQVQDRPQTEGRNQLVLDISRNDVQDFMIGFLDYILSNSTISYIKWDFNRHLTEINSCLLKPEEQGMLLDKWVKGLYRVLNHILKNYPKVLLESCSGGGGRYDLSFMFYSHQIWTSDNTDAIERIEIQRGTSLFYPSISMSNHVSVVPNHQIHRVTPWDTRHTVAMSGVFGYELNLNNLSPDELLSMKDMIKLYKHVIAPTILFGELYRITPLIKHQRITSKALGFESWMYVNEDSNSAVVYFVLSKYFQAFIRLPRLQLKGLNKDFHYKVERYENQASNSWPGYVTSVEGLYSGRTLMNAGLLVQVGRDAQSILFVIRKVRQE